MLLIKSIFFLPHKVEGFFYAPNKKTGYTDNHHFTSDSNERSRADFPVDGELHTKYTEKIALVSNAMRCWMGVLRDVSVNEVLAPIKFDVQVSAQ